MPIGYKEIINAKNYAIKRMTLVLLMWNEKVSAISAAMEFWFSAERYRATILEFPPATI